MSGLPRGWETQYSDDGRQYYLDHNTRRTHWNHPEEEFFPDQASYGAPPVYIAPAHHRYGDTTRVIEDDRGLFGGETVVEEDRGDTTIVEKKRPGWFQDQNEEIITDAYGDTTVVDENRGFFGDEKIITKKDRYGDTTVVKEDDSWF